MIKKLLKKHKYPPDGMDDAVQTVMLQRELWTDINDMSGRAESYDSRLNQYAKASYDIGRENQDLMMVAEDAAPYGKKKDNYSRGMG